MGAPKWTREHALAAGECIRRANDIRAGLAEFSRQHGLLGWGAAKSLLARHKLPPPSRWVGHGVARTSTVGVEASSAPPESRRSVAASPARELPSIFDDIDAPGEVTIRTLPLDAPPPVDLTAPHLRPETPAEFERADTPAEPPAAFAKLVDATRRGPVDFEALCDRLELAPRKCRDLIERAQAAGYSVEVAHNRVAFRLAEPDERVRDLGVAPVVGERQRIAVISDTHLGSKYCLRAQLREFVETAYASGVREILHPGDVLDGCYKHGVFELTHSGIEEQTRDLFETLPRLDGLTYHAICGNHDDTFSDAIGIDAGGYMQNYFEARGRRDLRFHGRRGAYLKVRGAVVELWHPKKSPGYSLSYGLQNHIRDYGVGQKPDLLLVGHWHTWVYLEQRGVHALACGTFQGSGSAFGKSLGGAPSIGGTLISWDLTEHGTLRRVAVERSAYFEHEQPREIA